MFALQAIETKYHGPTNTRGSRHSATTCEGRRRVIVSVPPELSGVECHAYAARQLAEKMGWDGQWHAGGTKAGYVFVLIPDGAVDPGSDTGRTEPGTLAFTVEKGRK